jgi:mRNA-degrading endonuclease RelE of RelBE toxin-antitoxin system
MKLIYTPTFRSNLKKFPKEIRKKFYKQADILLLNIRHSSLQAKKYGGEKGVWQARVDKNIRFYFSIEDDLYTLLDIKSHPK